MDLARYTKHISIGNINKPTYHDSILSLNSALLIRLFHFSFYSVIISDESHHLVLFVSFPSDFIKVHLFLFIDSFIMVFQTKLSVMFCVQIFNFGQRIY